MLLYKHMLLRAYCRVHVTQYADMKWSGGCGDGRAMVIPAISGEFVRMGAML